MPQRRRIDPFLLVVGAVYCAYAAVFIHRSSFVIGGERYFSLFDDIMISMQYGKNLAAGHGLVWNPGENVEGYTSLLWTVLMAPLHLLPIPLSKTGLVVQIAGAALLLLNLVFVARLAALVADGSRFATRCAVLLTAVSLPVNYWGLIGTEFSALVLILTASTWQALHRAAAGRFSAWPYVLLALGVVLRNDMVVPFAGIIAFVAAVDRAHRRRHLLVGGGALVAVAAALTVGRFLYHGEWLPNAYYEKLTGYPLIWRAARGLKMLVLTVLNMNWALCVAPLLLLPFRHTPRVLLPLLLIGLEGGYSVYVGGDAWEAEGAHSSRFLSMVMPLFFVLFATAVADLTQAIRTHLPARPWVAVAAGGAVIALAAFDFNRAKGSGGLRRWLLLERPYQVEQNERNVRIAVALRELTRPEARIGVVWGGAIPYFSGRHAIDLLGKCDRRLGRQQSRTPTGLRGFGQYVPGHTKYDYAYSVGELRPDLIVGAVQDPAVRPHLSQHRKVKLAHANLFLRPDSAAIHWDRLDRILAAER